MSGSNLVQQRLRSPATRLFFVACAVLVLAGCGGSSSSSNGGLSSSAFSSAANAICKDVNTATNAAGQPSEPTDVESAASAATVLAADVGFIQGADQKLKALSGPSALESARDAFVSKNEEGLTGLQAMMSAARSGDTAAYDAAAAKLEPLGQASGDLGAKLGPDCADSTS